MKFLCSDIDVSGENIVGNYVFEKCGLIVLFLVIGLGLVKGNGSHHAAYLCHLITAFHKHGIIKLAAAVTEDLICAQTADKHRLGRIIIYALEIIKAGADHGKLAAGDDKALIVYDADAPVGCLFYLNNNTLEYSA